MDDMSLELQIHQIEQLEQYIKLVTLESEQMTQEVTDFVNGLQTEGAYYKEICEKLMDQWHFGRVKEDLEKLLTRMNSENLAYLEGVRESLEHVLRL